MDNIRKGSWKRCCTCRQYFRPHPCAVQAQKSCSVECRIKRRRKLAKIRRERDLQDNRIDERQRQRKCRQRRRQGTPGSEKRKSVSETMSRTGLQMQADDLQRLILKKVDKQFRLSRATLCRDLEILLSVSVEILDKLTQGSVSVTDHPRSVSP